MAKINVSTPRTALLLLILIVACGLILSLIRMSDIPTTAYYTSSRQYIARVLDEAAAQQRNTDSLYVEDGPTQFQDDSIMNLQKDDRGQHNLPKVSEWTSGPATDQGMTAADPTAEQSTEPPTNEASPGYPASTESSRVDQVQSTVDGSTEPSTQLPSTSSEDNMGDSVSDTSSPPPTDEVQGTSQSNQGSKTEEGEVPSIANTDNTEPSGDTETKREGPVHVLLLTEGRSGSTWLSSYFWHRPEVYYTFEPLYQTPVWKKSGCSDTEERRKECDSEILSHFWNCDFHSSTLSVLGRYPSYHLDCQKGEYRCTTAGKEATCTAATHRVAKTIRLWDLSHIQDIMADTAHYDVRVIHLVRDPRPLLKSRNKYGFGSLDGLHRHGDYNDQQSFENQCATVCNRMLEIAQLGDNPPDWLKDRYVRITHEQMSFHPIETAKMLYKFVDMTWTKESEDFIYKTTIGEVGKGGMFGIGKVSTKVVNAWKMMQEPLIEQITRACYKTLTYFDYETDLEKIRQWKLDNADLFSEDEIAKVNEESTDNETGTEESL
ncbi:hypothetical protein ACHWQZ_G017355 [Mnemiopsis leidyi]